MASNMWWFFDLTVLMIVAGFVFVGYTRKLGKVLILLASYILAFSVGQAADSEISDAIYKSSLCNTIIENTETVLKNYDGAADVENILEKSFPGIDLESEAVKTTIETGGTDIIDKLTALVAKEKPVYNAIQPAEVSSALLSGYEISLFELLKENVPAFAVNRLAENLSEDTVEFTTVIRTVALDSIVYENTKLTAARYLEETSFSQSIHQIIRLVAFLTMFFVTLTICRVIAISVKELEKFDVAKKPSLVAAATFSLFEGIIIAFIVAIAVKCIILASDEELIFLNETTVDKTILFKYIYYLNIV